MRPARRREEKRCGDIDVAVSGARIAVFVDIERTAIIAHLPLHEAVAVAVREEKSEQAVEISLTGKPVRTFRGARR